jgi:hypothetical protein
VNSGTGKADISPRRARLGQRAKNGGGSSKGAGGVPQRKVRSPRKRRSVQEAFWTCNSRKAPVVTRRLSKALAVFAEVLHFTVPFTLAVWEPDGCFDAGGSIMRI